MVTEFLELCRSSKWSRWAAELELLDLPELPEPLTFADSLGPWNVEERDHFAPHWWWNLIDGLVSWEEYARIISGNFSQSAQFAFYIIERGGRRAGSAGLLQTEREWGGLFVSSAKITKTFKSEAEKYSPQTNYLTICLLCRLLFSLHWWQQSIWHRAHNRRHQLKIEPELGIGRVLESVFDNGHDSSSKSSSAPIDEEVEQLLARPEECPGWCAWWPHSNTQNATMSRRDGLIACRVEWVNCLLNCLITLRSHSWSSSTRNLARVVIISTVISVLLPQGWGHLIWQT